MLLVDRHCHHKRLLIVRGSRSDRYRDTGDLNRRLLLVIQERLGTAEPILKRRNAH